MTLRDRKLVKNPKPLRIDAYLDEYIAASANVAGVSWSEMARMMLQESASHRINSITNNQATSNHIEGERI